MFMPNYIWAFLIALFVALIVTPAVIVLAAKTGAMDAPDARKVHKGPMPRIGGLAIYCGFMAAILAMLNFAELTQEVANGVIGLLLGGTLIVIIGLIDDYKNLPAKVKLLGQIMAACVVVYFDVRIDVITDPFGDYLYLEYLAAPATVFWIVGLTNTVNLIDGLDGKFFQHHFSLNNILHRIDSCVNRTITFSSSTELFASNVKHDGSYRTHSMSTCHLQIIEFYAM